jgi:hypothetical protein
MGTPGATVNYRLGGDIGRSRVFTTPDDPLTLDERLAEHDRQRAMGRKYELEFENT